MVLSELDLKEGIRVWNTVHYKTEWWNILRIMFWTGYQLRYKVFDPDM